ncbi:MAG: putative membrane protein [Pseudohongiellaceae bacterium]|jgi:uncharacterized membrane protein
MIQKKAVGSLFESIGESTAACLFTMVQGNLLILGAGHWIIASQTGVVAGVLATLALLLAKTQNRLVISAILGMITVVVDYFIHPGMLGPEAAEAIFTGLGAAVLSYIVGSLIALYRKRRNIVSELAG